MVLIGSRGDRRNHFCPIKRWRNLPKFSIGMTLRRRSVFLDLNLPVNYSYFHSADSEMEMAHAFPPKRRRGYAVAQETLWPEESAKSLLPNGRYVKKGMGGEWAWSLPGCCEKRLAVPALRHHRERSHVGFSSRFGERVSAVARNRCAGTVQRADSFSLPPSLETL
jgi:hypothetical protein